MLEHMLCQVRSAMLARMTTPNTGQTLTFLRRGQPMALRNVPPDRTLLQVLREDLQLTATKEGCGEGDCGACTVVIGEAVDGKLMYRAINSCIRLAHSVAGMAVWTAEDIAAPALDTGVSLLPGACASAGGDRLHPVQEALMRCHGSQCGFCTPGFVMSLFATYQHTNGGQNITRERAQADLSGNLCRCTGYRPIFDAAMAMGSLPLPAGCEVNETATLAALAKLQPEHPDSAAYLRPTTLRDLLQARARHPQAQVVAGCTDVGLWVTKQHRQFAQVLDVTAARELRQVESHPHHIAIGAAVPLVDAYAALVAERPQLKAFAQRFAGLPVRNSGTLGGNVANGSPIGDSMPLLIALGASVLLMRWDAKRGAIAHRELALEDLYTGYRTNVMRADELLCWIKVPRPTANETLKVYKISKRFDDDISAVCLAIQMTLADGVVAQVSIGVGGVAATPVRAKQTEATLRGQPWNADTVMAAQAALGAEFQPISDMRASAAYRHTVLVNLLQRFWLESQGLTAINLESATAEDLA
jgi:xanthine dehydrogenase small subunit